jgi:hypothetical protein
MLFTGNYFIIDLPPVLMLQNYFNRLSNWPSYYGENLINLNGRKTILESVYDLDNFVTNHFNNNEFDESLFMATWSLSEISIYQRNNIIKQISLAKYGYIFVSFCKDWENIDNLNYFINLSNLINDEYSICIWEMDYMKNNYYFIAKKRILNGFTICDNSIGCNRNNKVYGDCSMSIIEQEI